MQNILGLFGFSGGGEIILVLVVILLLFGAKRLPELARSLGKSLGEFKKGREEGEKKDKPAEDGGKEPDGGGSRQA